jgi:hypothetical protein
LGRHSRHRAGGDSDRRHARKIEDADLKYLKITDADQRFLKIDDANATFLKLDDAAIKYLKIDDANATYLKLDEAAIKYLKIDDANATYLKIDEAAQKYLKIDDAAYKYLSLDEAARVYLKIADADARYAKIGDVVAGHGSVYTGFQAVAGDETKTVLDVRGYLLVEAHSKGTGEGVDFILTAPRSFNGQAQVALGDGSVRLVDVKLDEGGTQTISSALPAVQLTLQLVHTEQDQPAQVLTATLNASGAEGPSLVSGQALLGTATP